MSEQDPHYYGWPMDRRRWVVEEQAISYRQVFLGVEFQQLKSKV